MSSAEPNASVASKASQKGIWVASYPKSGNTWVRIFIHNLFRELRGDGGEAQDINALGEHTAWELSSSLFEAHLGKPAVEATRTEIAKARYDVHTELARRHSKPFFIKTHNCVANVEGFPTVNLDVTLAAIYIIRNPLDIAISYAHHSGLSIDAIIDHMGNEHALSGITQKVVYEFSGTWSFHVASWMSVPSRPVHVIRYEDMLTAPDRVFSSLAAFLRLKPSPDQLKNAVRKSSFAVLADQETESGFIERPEKSKKFFRQGEAGQWRRVLQPVQIRQIISDHAPMMQRCGYLLPDCGRSVSSDLGPFDAGHRFDQCR